MILKRAWPAVVLLVPLLTGCGGKSAHSDSPGSGPSVPVTAPGQVSGTQLALLAACLAKHGVMMPVSNGAISTPADTDPTKMRMALAACAQFVPKQ